MNLRNIELTNIGLNRKSFELDKPVHWIKINIYGEDSITVANLEGTIMNDINVEFTKNPGIQTIDGKLFIDQKEHDLLHIGVIFDLDFSDAGGHGYINTCRIYKIDKEDNYNIYYFITVRKVRK